MFHINDDDRCQHSDECTKSMFSYCSHCRRFLCFIHLKQHHDMMKHDITQMIIEADHQRVSIQQQIDNIKQQQMILNNFYEREMKHLNEMHDSLVNICENKLDNQNFHTLMHDYEKNTKQLARIKKEDEEKNSLPIQIDQILKQQNEMKQSKEKQNTKLIIDSHINKLPTDCQNDVDSKNLSLHSKWLINLPNHVCPLSSANAFGFSTDHHIIGMPCDSLKNCTSLTYGRCYYHLITYHRLKPSVAKIIMQTLSSYENQSIDVTTINIFSKWSSVDILSQSRSAFLGHCPLTEENVFGIQRHHNVTLCTPRAPVHVYQHLLTFHRFKHKCALRLVGALIDKKPISTEIFQSNEHIINTSIRSKHRRRFQ
ncbi:hypothetical protein I4U23_026277 [Adineta vaga]|uniref:Uncharacterized protein n=1 Tax=Adineta vaga TaxID=104782 RepID=B3G3W9_ADIVA|nr:hypothetical protein [Adineta vaga]UJR23257.1 hypothetical protein I4U23_026277 [Adineta vaga]